MDKVPINRILPYSVVDGPGNRVAIFVQKCNIHCLYCHNPETQNICFNCGECLKYCPVKALSLKDNKVVWNKKICVFCDTCIKVCKYHASPKITYMDVKEVFDEVKKSIPFIRGITVSGGECDLYPDFLYKLFKLAHKNSLTCLIDSNGTIDLSLYPDLMKESDGVMLDVKAWDNKIFEKLTGYDNEIVKKNLLYLNSINKIEELRIVCLPNYVDAEEVIVGIANTLGNKVIRNIRLKLIKFRRFGVKGELENHSSPSDSYMRELEALARKNGFDNIVLL